MDGSPGNVFEWLDFWFHKVKSAFLKAEVKSKKNRKSAVMESR